jgi:hypothetical protein
MNVLQKPHGFSTCVINWDDGELYKAVLTKYPKRGLLSVPPSPVMIGPNQHKPRNEAMSQCFPNNPDCSPIFPRAQLGLQHGACLLLASCSCCVLNLGCDRADYTVLVDVASPTRRASALLVQRHSGESLSSDVDYITIAPRECGWKHGDSGERLKEKPGEQNEIRIYLTPTGLLMEGDLTQNPCRGILSAIRIYRQLGHG